MHIQKPVDDGTEDDDEERANERESEFFIFLLELRKLSAKLNSLNFITKFFSPIFSASEIDHQMEKEKIDDESQKSDSSSPDPNSNEVIIPILNKKNGPILQSQ